MTRISSSNALSGIDKNSLIGTVSLIDKLKSGETLRSKLLKDVAAVTEFLEKRAAQTRQIKQPSLKPTAVEEIAKQVNRQVERTQPSNEQIASVVTERLERLVNRAKAELAEKPANDAPQVVAPGAGKPDAVPVVDIPIQVVAPGSGESPEGPAPVGSGEGEAVEVSVPGSGSSDSVDIEIVGVGSGDSEPLVAVSVPGSGEDFVEPEFIQVNVKQVDTAEFTTDAVVAQLIDQLV
jgi:hypothetical protein